MSFINTPTVVACLVLTMSAPSSVYAQKNEVVATGGGGLVSAMAVRAELARQTKDDRGAALKSLAALRSARGRSGLPIADEADFGYAAVDIGRRLVAEGRMLAAEEFFKAAEAALVSAASRASADDVTDQVQYLQSLAEIRGSYLGKADEAGADLAAALKLRPGDERLRYLARKNAGDRATRNTTESAQAAQKGER